MPREKGTKSAGNQEGRVRVTGSTPTTPREKGTKGAEGRVRVRGSNSHHFISSVIFRTTTTEEHRTQNKHIWELVRMRLKNGRESLSIAITRESQHPSKSRTCNESAPSDIQTTTSSRPPSGQLYGHVEHQSQLNLASNTSVIDSDEMDDDSDIGTDINTDSEDDYDVDKFDGNDKIHHPQQMSDGLHATATPPWTTPYLSTSTVGSAFDTTYEFNPSGPAPYITMGPLPYSFPSATPLVDPHPPFVPRPTYAPNNLHLSNVQDKDIPEFPKGNDAVSTTAAIPEEESGGIFTPHDWIQSFIEQPYQYVNTVSDMFTELAAAQPDETQHFLPITKGSSTGMVYFNPYTAPEQYWPPNTHGHATWNANLTTDNTHAPTVIPAKRDAPSELEQVPRAHGTDPTEAKYNRALGAPKAQVYTKPRHDDPVPHATSYSTLYGALEMMSNETGVDLQTVGTDQHNSTVYHGNGAYTVPPILPSVDISTLHGYMLPSAEGTPLNRGRPFTPPVTLQKQSAARVDHKSSGTLLKHPLASGPLPSASPQSNLAPRSVDDADYTYPVANPYVGADAFALAIDGQHQPTGNDAQSFTPKNKHHGPASHDLPLGNSSVSRLVNLDSGMAQVADASTPSSLDNILHLLRQVATELEHASRRGGL